MSQRQPNAATTKQACRECRLNKVKCDTAQDRAQCGRCARHGFECSFANLQKRGRKAKRKWSGDVEVSMTKKAKDTVEEEVHAAKKGKQKATSYEECPFRPPLLFDTTLRKRAWEAVTHVPANRGSTYSFVSSGNADVVRGSDEQNDDLIQPERTTLRRLLQPVITAAHRRRTSHPTSQRQRPISAPSLPRTLHLDLPRDPCEAGLLSKIRRDQLLAYFTLHMQPWVAVVEDVASPALLQCPLLVTTLCYQASKYEGADPGETEALAWQCRSLCVMAFAETDSRPEIVLAFYLLAAWKSADDDFTDWYMSYADQVAKYIGARPSSSRQLTRIQHFHYVQRHVFLLHHGSSYHFDRRIPAAARHHQQLSTNLVEWCQSLQTLEGDWFLCADVESTSIQCRYALAFSEREQRQSTTADKVNSTALLDAFLSEMDEWESRWSREAEKKTMRLQHRAGFGLFKHSVRNHVGACALKAALRVWLQERAKFNLTHSSLSLTDEYLSRAYIVCLEDALGVLDQFILFSSDSDDTAATPHMLLHAPDSLVLLADHAALTIIYLLLLPGVLLQMAHSFEKSGRDRPDDDRTPMPNSLTTMLRTAEYSAEECLDKLQRVKEAMNRAAAGARGEAKEDSAVHVSCDYLAALMELNGSNSAQGLAREANNQHQAKKSSRRKEQSEARMNSGSINTDTEEQEASDRITHEQATSEWLPNADYFNAGSSQPPDKEPAPFFDDWLHGFLISLEGRDAATNTDWAEFPMPNFMM